MKEYGQERNEKRGKLFAWKPYLSVCFGDEDPQASESSLLDGEIHRYPRVRALGIMLVEIGIGMPLLAADQTHTGQPQASDINEGLLLAMRYAKDEKLWRDCDYPNYLSAVNECLDPDIFSAAPYIRGVEEKARLESLKQRRNIMYDKVVFPLEELLQATKWMDQVTSIGPLDTPVETTPLVSFAEQPSSIKDSASGVTAPQQTSRKAAKANTEGKKEARRWLSRMRRLNDELAMSQITPAASSAPVRIVVLDTGCDDNAPFFFHPDNEPRLKGWKDWVDGSTQWQDTHGHGTHLVSLIMQIAPDAHVYVARVSKSPGELLQASENVAQVWRVLLYPCYVL
jgi:hypothetical protein